MGWPGEGWVDSHSHLQDTYLTGAKVPGGPPEQAGTAAGALAGTLGRAGAAGVRRIVCIGTGPATSASALALAADSAQGRLDPAAPALWATVGLHPHDAADGVDETMALLERAAADPTSRLVAVGECGLDYHYDHSPRAVQREAFAAQVAAAHRLGLALVIHARDAWDDLLGVLGDQGVPGRSILHCFTGGPQEARRCLDAGMYLSFSGIVSFKNAGGVREAAALCPPDRLLVETDSPFLAPVPHRGKPNEPAFVPLVGAAVAAARDVAAEEVAAVSWENAEAVFGLSA